MKSIILEKPGVGKIVLPGIDEKQATEEIVSGIVKYIMKTRGNGVVIGLSGGVDSSLVAVLCKKAMDEMDGRFYTLILPSKENNDADKDDAISLAQSLGLIKQSLDVISKTYSGFSVIYIDELGKIFSSIFPMAFKSSNTVPHENMLSRCRMILLYGLKEAMPGIRVAGTGNWDEDGLGYFTKYGDGGVDFSPLGMLSKRMVCALAKYNGVPEKIINKKPSAGLRKGQTDEEDLGCTYLQAEIIVRGKEFGEKIVDICQRSDNPEIRAIDKSMVKRILHRHEKLTPHKLNMPPVMKVTFSD